MHGKIRIEGALAGAIVAAVITVASPAGAAPGAGGPVAAVGYSSKSSDREIITYALGWRFEWEAGERLQLLADRLGARSGLLVESTAGLITGDAESVEVSAVPMVRLVWPSRGGREPFIEGGVGLAYTDLRGFDLGSQILFANQFATGVSIGVGDGSIDIGFRIRHISHAGLWAKQNSGLNTYYLTLTFR
jgi:hypothetical protein